MKLITRKVDGGFTSLLDLISLFRHNLHTVACDGMPAGIVAPVNMQSYFMQGMTAIRLGFPVDSFSGMWCPPLPELVGEEIGAA